MEVAVFFIAKLGFYLDGIKYAIAQLMVSIVKCLNANELNM
ncbi:hypothetical protein [Sedimentibacter sp. zth1]|nr:hypothetical protein [Sedimentibacter sp. zth1]